jgi:translation initiation factor IF-1
MRAVLLSWRGRSTGSDPRPAAFPEFDDSRKRIAGTPAAGRSDWRRCMAKEELMQFDGLVIEILPDARYRVQLDQGHEIVAYTAGKMKKNRIKTLAGDRVTVEMSPYDLEKGRLVFRHKDERSSGPRPPVRGGQFRRR